MLHVESTRRSGMGVAARHRMHGTQPRKRADAVQSNGTTRRSTRVLIALMATVVVGGALKATAAVTVPLAFALFLIALFWPVYRAMNRRAPAGLAAVGTLFVFLLFVGVIVAGLWISVQRVIEAAPASSNDLSELVRNARDWAKGHGIPVATGADTGSGLTNLLKRSSRITLETLAGFVLVIAFLVLGLLEVYAYRDRFKNGLEEDQAERWLGVIERVTQDFRRYFVVRTGIGVLTGTSTALACWIIGLESPLLWGVINFLLNYVPTLGSIVGVLPPTLFALIQFDGLVLPGVTLAAVGGVQLVMGNYVDPLLQGRYLSLSPVVVLLSVTFWGWVWGVIGALIGVPITMVVVLLCREFDSTRWIAVVLANTKQVAR